MAHDLLPTVPADAAPFDGGTLVFQHRLKQRAGRTYAVQINYDGPLTTSAIDVEFGNDGTNWLDYTAENEITIVQPPAGGSERTTGVNWSFTGYEWVQITLTWSAGTPNVTATIAEQA